MLRLFRWMVQREWPIRALSPLFGRFNPFHPDQRRDPYPAYRALRESAPVYRHPLLRVWYLSRYADVIGVLRDRRFSCDRSRIRNVLPGMDPTRSLSPDFVEAIRGNMLMLDPPRHTRLRNLVNKAFTPRAVERLRPRIQALVDELLDRAEAAGEMDLVRDLAGPLPIIVIMELLGVSMDARERFKTWSDDLTGVIDPFSTPRGLAGAQQAFRAVAEHFGPLFAERRRAPRDDLLSALVAAEDRDGALTEAELLSITFLLLAAGHETTTNLIGNAGVALLRHPGERKRLRDDPGLLPSAVEEILRYDSPVQFTDRVAVEDVPIGGHTIRPGDVAVCMLGSANRDPEHFPDPDRLDLGRGDEGHLSFGHGLHFCLGAQLARAEAQIAIGGLLRRFPDLHGDPEPPGWVPSLLLRGPTSLPISLR